MNIRRKGCPTIDSDTIKELYKLKEAILKNDQHKGKAFEVIFEAYTQIQKYFGRPKPSRACKSGCVRQMNTILKNWFALHSASGGTIPEGKKTPVEKAMSASQGGSLVTLEDRRKKLDAMSYGDLKAELKEKIGEEAFKLINGKKPAKKIQVIEELLKL